MEVTEIINRVNAKVEVPDWLKTNAVAEHQEFGRGTVLAVFGENAIVNFGGKRKSVSTNSLAQAVDLVIEQDSLNSHANIDVSAYRQIVKELGDAVSLVEVEPPEQGRLLDPPDDLNPDLRNALGAAGISRLFSHQIEGLQGLRAGLDIAPATPTASGKTLTFNVGIFEGLLNNPGSTAMYLFPLKALATDQVGKLNEIANGLPSSIRPRIGVITGDVKTHERERLFRPRHPEILAFSPDVLHHQLYKIKKVDEWQQWRLFLRGLRYVVIDEAHTYVGAFGANFANLIRRLMLAVDTCGGDSSKLQFVFATATVGNIEEMCLKFSGRTADRLKIIDKSGAGSKGRTTVCLSPAFQPLKDAAEIVHSWLKYGVSGIVFTNSRNEAKSLHGMLRRDLGIRIAQVAAYYGGLQERQRDEVVSGIRNGKIKIVISTSALEAGLDLPALDACLTVGFAGSLMSHRQRIGRAGRANPGLVMFLPSDKRPLDGFYGKKPKSLIYGQVESAQFNPYYPSILSKHLLCAAAESGVPITAVADYFGEPAIPVLDAMLSQKVRQLNLFDGRFTATGYPHFGVNLRGAAADTVKLIDADTDETIEEMDVATAYKEAHQDAIYSAYVSGQIQRYKCIEFDTKKRTAKMQRWRDDRMSTYAIGKTTVNMQSKLASPVVFDTEIDGGRLRLTLGWGRIVRSVFGYRLTMKDVVNQCRNRSCQNFNVDLSDRICPVCQRGTRTSEKNKVVDTVQFDKPLSVSHEAPIVKIEINPAFRDAIADYVEALKQEITIKHPGNDYPSEVETLWTAKPEFVALHSIAHQLGIALPMLVLASQYDIDALIVDGDEDTNPGLCPTIGYLFDTVEGGNGASEDLFHRFRDFAVQAKKLAESCDCSYGCPKCLLVGNCSQYNQGLSKQLGLYTLGTIQLNEIIGGEDSDD